MKGTHYFTRTSICIDDVYSQSFNLNKNEYRLAELTSVESLSLEEEKVLIRNAKANPAAFRPLYEKYYKSVFLFILKRVADKTLTADLTSQVFLKSLQSIDKYEVREFFFSSWLYRIAINEINQHYRKQNKWRYITIEGELEGFFSEMGADVPHNSEQTLSMALGKLNEIEMNLIELRFFESRPFKEIGDILGKSEVYVKVKTYRILDKLRGILKNTR